jgi:tetratricopeptide (TPR) repeat protein
MGLLEGTYLLLRRAQRFKHSSDEEINEVGNIVVALDHFPLALDQAGAYIEETKCRFGDYLETYQNHRKELLTRRGTQATNYPDSVATTWSLSFQKVEQANPAAAELLRLCAFLAPDRIPEELFKDGAAHWPPLLQLAAADLFTFNQMIEELLKFSLVKRLAEDHLLSIHRLVQAVQMDKIESDEQRQWAERVIGAVNEVFPGDSDDVATWPKYLRYLEQSQACDALIQQHMFVLPEAAELLEQTGDYLRAHASYTIAESLYLRALRIWEQLLGPEDTDVAYSLNNLAKLYDDQDKFSEAEPLYLQALRIWEQQLGPECSDVAYPLNGLANIYYKQGKYLEAESLYKDALRISEQQLGPEHPDVAYPLNGLADLYREQGKYGEAEPLYKRALRIWERILGPEHHLLAYPLNGLAILYTDQGKYSEAEPLYLQALSVREQKLGPEHPETAEVIYDLARFWEAQDNHEEAWAWFTRALAVRKQALGENHPKTLETRVRLRAMMVALRKTGEAARLDVSRLEGVETEGELEENYER